MKSLYFQLMLCALTSVVQAQSSLPTERCPSDPEKAFSQYENFERLNLLAVSVEGELRAHVQPIKNRPKPDGSSETTDPATEYRLHYKLAPGGSLAEALTSPDLSKIKEDQDKTHTVNAIMDKLKVLSAELATYPNGKGEKMLELPEVFKAHFSRNLYNITPLGPVVKTPDIPQPQIRVVNGKRRDVWVYKLTPKTSREIKSAGELRPPGNFEGEFILDAKTCWPIKAEGKMVNIPGYLSFKPDVDRFTTEYTQVESGYYASRIYIRTYLRGLTGWLSKRFDMGSISTDLNLTYERDPQIKVLQAELLRKYLVPVSTLSAPTQQFAVGESRR